MTVFSSDKAEGEIQQFILLQTGLVREFDVPELETTVFIVPAGYVKNGEARLIVLNRIAQSVIEEQRNLWEEKSDYVFPSPRTLELFTKMRTNSWKMAWVKAGLPTGHEVRQGVHVLKHTCGRRLRAAGVSRETRKVCLGHTDGDITTHYSSAEILELKNAFELLCERREGIVAKPKLKAVMGKAEAKTGKSRQSHVS